MSNKNIQMKQKIAGIWSKLYPITLMANVYDVDNNPLDTVLTNVNSNLMILNNEKFNVKKYGAKGDGLTNDTVAIQNAITDCQNNSGGVVYFPAGVYLYTNLSISENSVTLEGCYDASILKQTIATGIGVTINNSGKRLENVNIMNLTFDTSIVRTANACVAFSDVIKPTIDRCKFYNQYDAINVEVYAGAKITNVIIEKSKRRGIYINFGDDLIIDNCLLSNSGMADITNTYGIYWRCGGGLYISNTDVIECDYGMYISPETGENASWGFFNALLLDTCGNGLIANGFSGSIRGIHTTNCWFSSADRDGIRLINVKSYFSSNDRILLNGLHGMFVNASTIDVNISNSHFIANNVTGGTTNSGIYFEPNASNFKILGCEFANEYTGFTVFNQKYGIYIDSGASNNYMIIGNKFRANLLGTIYNPNNSANVIIKDNLSNDGNTIVSTETIVIPTVGDYFIVTGTTNIVNANLLPKGKVITLIFQNALNINGGFNIKLTDSHMLTTVNSTLTLISSGTYWLEVSRSFPA